MRAIPSAPGECELKTKSSTRRSCIERQATNQVCITCTLARGTARETPCGKRLSVFCIALAPPKLHFMGYAPAQNISAGSALLTQAWLRSALQIVTFVHASVSSAVYGNALSARICFRMLSCMRGVCVCVVRSCARKFRSFLDCSGLVAASFPLAWRGVAH